MIAIDLGEDAFAQEMLELMCDNLRQRYDLRGVLCGGSFHCIITGSGMVRYHEGLLTGRSLVYEGMAPILIPRENAIIGIYLRSP
jgi:hypothetical protein